MPNIHEHYDQLTAAERAVDAVAAAILAARPAPVHTEFDRMDQATPAARAEDWIIAIEAPSTHPKAGKIVYHVIEDGSPILPGYLHTGTVMKRPRALPRVVHQGTDQAHSSIRITVPARRRRTHWCNECADWFEDSRTTATAAAEFWDSSEGRQNRAALALRQGLTAFEADNAAHTDWSALPDPWKAKLIGTV